VKGQRKDAIFYTCYSVEQV